MRTWHSYTTPELAAQAAANRIAEIIEQTLQNNALCHIALPGGNTPIKCFYYLSQKAIDWDKTHWYLGDERCLPVGHAERNDTMIQEYLWMPISAPKKTIHRLPAELGPESAAKIYAANMNNTQLDIAFLGLGEDGHTASLFPNNAALKNTASVVPVFDAPKAPAERVSLSVSTLQQAKHRIVLTAGAGKKLAIEQIKAGVKLPISRIGDIEWFGDAAALGVI